MDSVPAPAPMEALLTHREWVRRVARALVADEHGAADLEQDLWVKVLERPPTIRGSVRGWIAATLRNSLLNRRRGESRREGREKRVSRPEAGEAAADVVADAEAVRRLMDAVLALQEPSRTTVLLRYYEDMPPGAVARRMGVPVETVRTRLRRALAALRYRLGKGRGAGGWLAALAPISGIDPGTAAGGPGVAAGVLGGTVMTGKTTILAAALLAIAAGFVGGSLAGPGGADAGDLARRVEALESVDRKVPVPSGTEARWAEQDLRIRALEAEVADSRKGSRADAPPAPAAPRGLEALTSEELLAEIRRLSRQRHRTREEVAEGSRRTVAACDAFLGRSVEAPLRVEVLTAKGVACRGVEDFAGAEAALHGALDLAGPTTTEGRSAIYHLAITASARKDDRAAADLLFGVARQAETPTEDRLKFRWWGAGYLEAVDRAGALAELRAVVEEFGGSEDRGLRHWVDQARRDIARIEAADLPR
jgi:RNA polymerase sigma factor (sigma-70 family)